MTYTFFDKRNSVNHFLNKPNSRGIVMIESIYKELFAMLVLSDYKEIELCAEHPAVVPVGCDRNRFFFRGAPECK